MLAYDSIDVYQNPKTKKDEIHAVYNGYSKFISREFRTKEEAMEDRGGAGYPLLPLRQKRQKKTAVVFRKFQKLLQYCRLSGPWLYQGENPPEKDR